MTDRILPPSQYDFEFELNRAFSRGEQKDFAQAARVDQSLVSRRFNPNETATESGMYAAAFELWCAKMTSEDLFEAFAAQIEGWIKTLRQSGNEAERNPAEMLGLSIDTMKFILSVMNRIQEKDIQKMTREEHVAFDAELRKAHSTVEQITQISRVELLKKATRAAA